VDYLLCLVGKVVPPGTSVKLGVKGSMCLAECWLWNTEILILNDGTDQSGGSGHWLVQSSFVAKAL
jgi:hypothetical protein